MLRAKRLGLCLLVLLVGTSAQGANDWLKWFKSANTVFNRYQQDNAANTFNAVVIAVHDGDSLRVRDGQGNVYKARLAFVDAPEIKQAYGLASRDGLRTRVLGQTVTVAILERDRYQREVMQVWLGNEDIGLWQVQQGAAWHYRSIAKNKQPGVAYAQYTAAELNARKDRQGLWQQYNVIPPWQFRRQ